MRTPGQEFGGVSMKTDHLWTCEANSLKGGSQKGKVENYNCEPSISARHCLIEPLPLRRIGGDGLRVLRTSRGGHNLLSLLTIFFYFRVTRTGIRSGTGKHASGHNVLPFACCKTQTTSCTLSPNFRGKPRL